ncbi:hypothetical protein ACQP2P_09300 [Dactylosporangium sp. CA-139114]|uniref:hypothetical protein n=1 Tax=Dactylosporangium sp. CA-139114 TaxID=3239931 RepID=UPI003D971191
MPDFASPAASAARLADAGHLTEEGPAMAGFLALRPHRRRPAACDVWARSRRRRSDVLVVRVSPGAERPGFARGAGGLVAARLRVRALVVAVVVAAAAAAVVVAAVAIAVVAVTVAAARPRFRASFAARPHARALVAGRVVAALEGRSWTLEARRA